MLFNMVVGSLHTHREVQNRTGLSLQALDYYLGLVSIEEMARSMGNSELNKTSET
jgi:hypothetical protein